MKFNISGIKISVLNAEDINNGDIAELFLNSISELIVGIYLYLRRGQNLHLAYDCRILTVGRANTR